MDAYTVKSAILGLVVADALGVPVEFESREALKADPVADMRGFGSYDVPAGSWSDDSSMALCLLESLTHGLNYDDQMKLFCRWADEAYMTPHDEVFDMGMATRKALQRYGQGTPALQCGGDGQQDNGNGSLMRILPLALWLYKEMGANFPFDPAAYEVIHNASALTHAHPISQMACGIYCAAIGGLLGGNTIWDNVTRGALEFYRAEPWSKWLPAFERIDPAMPVFMSTDDVRSTGYVVDTLEAALWCYTSTDNYKDCVLRAVNLGDDTDTVAAVAGGLAGLHYGCDAIPPEWIAAIAKRHMIEDLCAAFAGRQPNGNQ